MLQKLKVGLKAFNLQKLRFHAIYGVPLFLVIPYFMFFVIGYSLHGDIDFARRYGFLSPGLYSVILLVAIGRAIHFPIEMEKTQVDIYFGNPVAQLRRLLASSLVYFHPERVVYFHRNIHVALIFV